jgi:GntR family transcriptional regulator
MAIWLSINPRSGVPIYVQIVEQVKHALEVGTLRQGDPLPTVRQLASELMIAPNTIVKAYNELQTMGLIESRPGAGTTVTPSLNGSIREHQLEALLARMHQLVRDAAGLDLSRSELESHFDAEIERIYETRNKKREE